MLAVRRPLERWWVGTVTEVSQPGRQFQLEIFLAAGAGSLATVYNFVFYEFPIGSGL